MKFLFIVTAFFLGGASLFTSCGWTAARATVSDQEGEAEFRHFAAVGKTLFHDRHSDILDYLNGATSGESLKEHLQGELGSIPQERLEGLHKYYEDNFSVGGMMGTKLAYGLLGKPMPEASPLTKEEVLFGHFGIGVAASVLHKDTHHHLLPLSLNNLFAYYVGSENLFQISDDTEVHSFVSAEAPALPDLPTLPLVRKALQLQYASFMSTPLSLPLNPWDFAKAAGQFAFLEYGPRDYATKETVLFKDPMQRRLSLMREQATTLQDSIDFSSIGRISYEAYEGPTNKEKFTQLYIKTLGKYVDSLFRGSFLLKPESRTLATSIETAREGKKIGYGMMARLVVAQYPEDSASARAERIQTLKQGEWVLSCLEELFDKETGTPNFDHYFWGEGGLMNWDKLRTLQKSPSA